MTTWGRGKVGQHYCRFKPFHKFVSLQFSKKHLWLSTVCEKKNQGGAVIRSPYKSAFSCQQVAAGWILITDLSCACVCVCLGVYVGICVCVYGVTRDPLIITPLLCTQAPMSCNPLGPGKTPRPVKGHPKYSSATETNTHTNTTLEWLFVSLPHPCAISLSNLPASIWPAAGVYAQGGLGTFCLVLYYLAPVSLCVDRKWLSALQM